MLNWGVKDPDEVLDYQIDWAKPGDSRLEAGETLLTCNFTVSTGDVVIDSQDFVGTGLTTVWLSGGTSGTRNTILCRVTTSSGRTYDLSSHLRIRDR